MYFCFSDNASLNDVSRSRPWGKEGSRFVRIGCFGTVEAGGWVILDEVYVSGSGKVSEAWVFSGGSLGTGSNPRVCE
jgi:hypothetical protein